MSGLANDLPGCNFPNNSPFKTKTQSGGRFMIPFTMPSQSYELSAYVLLIIMIHLKSEPA